MKGEVSSKRNTSCSTNPSLAESQVSVANKAKPFARGETRIPSTLMIVRGRADFLTYACLCDAHHDNILSSFFVVAVADDDDSVVFRDPHVCISMPQLHHLNKPDRYLSPKASTVDFATGETGKGTPGSNPTTGDQDNIRHNNKRPTPSPAMGVEPAPVSIVHRDSDRMNTEDQDAMEEETNNEGDDHSLLSSSRRVSLSPLSRRLALQFDSISILAPAKPSRSKRRKTFDTSLQC